MAVATLDFFRPGSKESVLTREGLRLTPATAPAGVDRATYERTLVGARVGEQRSMPMEFTAGFPIEEARGERGEVRFTFQEILRVVPPADEEVFKAFGASDEASLRLAVRARIEKAKSESEEQRIETELLERLIEDHAMELPERLVDDQVEASQSELRAELAKQGLSEEEAKTRADGERERARAGAEKALKAAYLIEEIARAKELRVESADLSAELTSIAERNGTPVADVAKYYKEEGLMRQLGLELLERKVRRYLRASAAIKSSSASA
jgi:trigger factor